MRLLGATLVVISVALTAGGVVSRPLAATAQQAVPAQEVPEVGVCRVRSPGGTRVDLSQLAEHRPSVVPLNGAGYNYSSPGAYRPFVPSTESGPPSAPAER